jgi:hypothetical protein
MVQQTEAYNLIDLWRALSGQPEGDGWRTIPLEIEGNCSLRAARHFPDNTEAILLGFHAIDIPTGKNLPQGQGFKVDKITKSPAAANLVWISLSRLPAGNLDMFVMMAEDIVRAVHTNIKNTEERILQVFLSRIKAWQNFMDDGNSGVLNSEAETGLYGELTLLKQIMDAGIPPQLCIDLWRGPDGGIHDFSVDEGAIEVKSTVSTGAFPAKIGSLEQLDNTFVHPLFLAGVRLLCGSTGTTLPEFASDLRVIFSTNLSALNIYDCKLIQAGLFPPFYERYSRRFKYESTSLYAVDDDFPKLIRGTVPPEIMRVNYETDLSLIRCESLELLNVLSILGVS